MGKKMYSCVVLSGGMSTRMGQDKGSMIIQEKPMILHILEKLNYKINDAVIVKRTSDSIIDIGDIITFKSTDSRYEGLTVTHRIVGTQTISTGDLVYRTKGDNNRIEDSAVVKKENIYGKVVLKLPKVGYIKDFLRKPLGFILFIICPIILILFINIRNINKREEELD